MIKGVKKIELLAPAGSKEALIAAVEAGADAIYLGGQLFNARINANNFTLDEIRDAVIFCHKRDVSLFVTVNILIKEEELDEALNYCKELYKAGVDALILQDLGLGKIVREVLPDFPLHVSTQASVYDLDGVELAKTLGYERVVTARELSLREIEEVCRNTDVEIETFGHGALCFAYSGQCQLSRYIGGRSGNRGGCAQPCRLGYKTCENKEKYLLSPSDFCLLENLPMLIDAGVSSLKIEGRMKSPYYVAVVVSIYRKYIDMYYKYGEISVEEEDMKALEQIFNRGGFTTSHFLGEEDKDFLSGESPKNQGILIGEVIEQKKGSQLITCKLYEDLVIGDGVEIRGVNKGGNVVTYLKNIEGKTFVIGDFKNNFSKGDLIYRVTSKEQIDEAKGFYEGKDYREGKYLRKKDLSASVEFSKEGNILLKARGDFFFGGKSYLVNVEEVIKVDDYGEPKDLRSRLTSSLEKTKSTPYIFSNISVDDSFQWFCGSTSMSQINRGRRNLIEKIDKAIEKLSFRDVDEKKYDLPHSYLQDKSIEVYFYTLEDFLKFKKTNLFKSISDKVLAAENRLIYVLPLYYYKDKRLEGENLRYYISNIAKGREIENLKAKRLDLEKVEVYCGNLADLGFLKDHKAVALGDYGLNVYNSQSQVVLEKLGFKGWVGSLELEENFVSALPLMVTENSIEADEITDRKNVSYRILKREFSNQTLVISKRKSDREILDYLDRILEKGRPFNTSCKGRIYI